MNSFLRHVNWSYDTNIYEVNLRQYTSEGTFDAFAKELPRLRDMGVEVLWFMPITPISVEKRLGTLGSYYSCSDYTATNPEYGTVEDFKNLVQSAHLLEFKVIIDWVANHTGWDHRWTREYPDFYRKNAEGNFFDANGWEDVIDLNYYNSQLRKEMIESMRFWIRECNIDGFRCDMAMLVPLDFWRQARAELDPEKKLFWLAECELDAYSEVFDALYTWNFLHAMEAYWRKEKTILDLDTILKSYDKVSAVSKFHVFFTTNHDENSHSGSEYDRMGDAAKVFEVLCCTWNGIPLIYSGQELPNMKRLKFFDKDTIEWTGTYALHEFYKTLLQLRKRNSAMRSGDPASTIYRLSTNANDKIFAFLRKNHEEEVLVILNLSADKISVQMNDPVVKGHFKEVFADDIFDFDDMKPMDMPAWSFFVFEK
ncbi:MAG TPA: alpha-amylase family glycosyl hydrolase [Puia sp.]|nr:alpha-amylase family glycosyl hydrolase [Puia sp.]